MEEEWSLRRDYGKQFRNLRGCMGNPQPNYPLIVGAIQSGILAATSDPRFDPVALEEFRLRDRLELTVLSRLEEPPHQWGEIEGLYRYRETRLACVDGYGRRGLLLPQVAVDEGFDGEDFLTNCCLKAGLPPDAWLYERVKVYMFRGQVFLRRLRTVPH